jgi:hypothetical protein
MTTTTPQLQWEPLPLFAGRTEDNEFSLFKTSKKAMAIDPADVVRFKLAKTPGGEPVMDIDSLGPTSNGSHVAVVSLGVDEVTPAKVNVHVGQDDTKALKAGDYFGELGLVDVGSSNPANSFKRIAYGTVQVKASPGGDVGPT